jgi:phosphate:Na+ symporter
MNEAIEVVFGLLGGLALFLYGMNMMSEGLQKAAGEKMKYILGILTKNPIMGVLAGTVTTAVLQSSSATTVMVIGFVSAGLMSLPQAISVILGANIGTTMTAQIIAFQLSDYIWPIIFVGFFVYFLAKSPKVKNLGQTILAFGILFLGIETMGDVMKPLAGSPVFTDLIAKVSDVPVFGVILGTVMTLIVQSSSATIAVLQNFASQAGPDGITSVLGLQAAIPILLGDNIGTTITALLASVGQTKNAKRTAVAHSVFNITGSFLFIWIIPWFAKFIEWISPKGAEIEVISRQIANAHTTFNVVNTLIWIPLIWLMVKIVIFLIPGKDEEAADLAKPQFLDAHLFYQPVFAIHMLCKEVLRLGGILDGMLTQTKAAVLRNDIRALEAARKAGDAVFRLKEEMMSYISGLFAAGSVTEAQAGYLTSVMYVVEDLERVGRYNREITEAAREKIENSYKFSQEALEEIGASMDMAHQMYREAVQTLTDSGMSSTAEIQEKKVRIEQMEKEVRRNHVRRLNKGECKPEFTGALTQIMYNLERIGNSCGNIVETSSEEPELSRYFTEDGAEKDEEE